MHSQANIFSYVALFAWIPIALWAARRWPPAKAAALLFLIPVMFLPERVEFKLPGLPEFGKLEIAIFWLLIAVVLFHRRRLAAIRLNMGVKLAMVLILGGSAVTVLSNTDPIVDLALYVPSHRPYDVVHHLLTNTFHHILPFMLAVVMFNDSKDLRVFFRVLVGAALVYSILQIIEMVLSPQLHRWVYGFFQHMFAQAMRGGGYRPMVFMHHGLAVAMFTVSGVLAAAGLYKTKIKVFGKPAGWALVYLGIILFFSKSLAAFLYALIAVPLILFATPKMQFRVAALLAVFVLLYPSIRGVGLVPVDDIKDWVASRYGEDRADSLMMRLENEELLLERANERAFFGWGSYCRGCIFDPRTGETTSVTDGYWIITRGKYGRVGFLGQFLLLLLPIFLSASQLKYIRRSSDRRLLSALALIVAFSVFDLLPNGNWNYLVFVFPGVLLGCSEGIRRHQAVQAAQKQEKERNAAQDVIRGSAPITSARP